MVIWGIAPINAAEPDAAEHHQKKSVSLNIRQITKYHIYPVNFFVNSQRLLFLLVLEYGINESPFHFCGWQ